MLYATFFMQFPSILFRKDGGEGGSTNYLSDLLKKMFDFQVLHTCSVNFEYFPIHLDKDLHKKTITATTIQPFQMYIMSNFRDVDYVRDTKRNS